MSEINQYIASIKIIGVPISASEKVNKSFEDNVVNKGLEYGEVEVVVSNDAIDRQGESIKLNGIDLAQIKRNPTLLWAHDYSKLPIGKITDIRKSKGDLIAKLSLDYDIDEFSEKVYRKILKGSLNAVSLGGMVHKWNEDYTVIEKLEMFELSVVPVGAHRDALVTAKDVEGINQLNKRLQKLEKQLESKEEPNEVIRKTLIVTI